MSTKVTAKFSDEITLEQPIKRDDKSIKTIKLRTPSSGELRGLSLADLGQLDVTALHTLLPRITQPTITAQEVQNLHPADLVQFGTQVTNFLLPSSMKDSAAPVT